MAASLCLAFSLVSLGHFPRRSRSWDSLSIMVDQVASVRNLTPTCSRRLALATMLMTVTLLVLSINERARAWRSGMMFELRNGTVTLGDWTVFQDLNLKVEAAKSCPPRPERLRKDHPAESVLRPRAARQRFTTPR